MIGDIISSATSLYGAIKEKQNVETATATIASTDNPTHVCRPFATIRRVTSSHTLASRINGVIKLRFYVLC